MRMQILQRILVLTVLAGSLGPWGCTRAKNSTAPSRPEATEILVKAVPARFEEWVERVPVSGNLHSQSIVVIKSEAGGKLIATYFEEGDQVRKNQLLAEIDPANYRLAYDQAAASVAVAQAGLERAQVLLDHARREMDRAENLLHTGGITEKDHQAAITGVREAETQVRFAEAQCAQARAAVATAEKSLRDCRIHAPADGYVHRKDLDKGSLLPPGAPLYTLVDNSRLELECLLPSYRLSEIRPGQPVQFTTPTWGARRFEGTVTAINPMVESDNRSVKVLVRIANPRGQLRSGMYACGEVEVRREARALVIPRSALIPEQEKSSLGSVYVIDEGLACRHSVRIAAMRQDRLWIQQGLEEGDLVIVDVGPSLKEGMAVRVATNAVSLVN